MRNVASVPARATCTRREPGRHNDRSAANTTIEYGAAAGAAVLWTVPESEVWRSGKVMTADGSGVESAGTSNGVSSTSLPPIITERTAQPGGTGVALTAIVPGTTPS